ncbi:TetR/AcrR family transcriptional regulator [Marinovum sp.]|uniref:TetR/AcrR family transcriptional regulator n=1 Tax=Marinovum sp. TaxID=2024839 RepID=UPI002B272EDC|nr:TetR/AcrR family transcriptional regulator [Marinovum sp.]
MPRAAPYDREATLEAAMGLFWRKGYHATSLKDLEAALAMKPGSIYAAFKSKQTLYLLAMERYFQRFRDQFRDRIAAAASPLQALADHLRSYAALSPGDANGQACMLVKSFVDTRSTDPVIADRAQGYLAEMRDEIAAGFERASQQGEIAPTSDCAALARRYQGYVNVLRLELHQGIAPADLRVLAESLAGEIEALRAGELSRDG